MTNNEPKLNPEFLSKLNINSGEFKNLMKDVNIDQLKEQLKNPNILLPQFEPPKLPEFEINKKPQQTFHIEHATGSIFGSQESATINNTIPSDLKSESKSWIEKIYEQHKGLLAIIVAIIALINVSPYIKKFFLFIKSLF